MLEPGKIGSGNTEGRSGLSGGAGVEKRRADSEERSLRLGRELTVDVI